eukprot:jgi/Mesen1/4682/ME000241S03721
MSIVMELLVRPLHCNALTQLPDSRLEAELSRVTFSSTTSCRSRAKDGLFRLWSVSSSSDSLRANNTLKLSCFSRQWRPLSTIHFPLRTSGAGSIPSDTGGCQGEVSGRSCRGHVAAHSCTSHVFSRKNNFQSCSSQRLIGDYFPSFKIRVRHSVSQGSAGPENNHTTDVEQAEQLIILSEEGPPYSGVATNNVSKSSHLSSYGTHIQDSSAASEGPSDSNNSNIGSHDHALDNNAAKRTGESLAAEVTIFSSPGARLGDESVTSDAEQEDAPEANGTPVQGASFEQAATKARNQLRKRVVFGTLIGAGAVLGIVAGGWVFTAGMAAIVFLGIHEYFELMQAKAALKNESPPSWLARQACSLACFLMLPVTMYCGGRIRWALVMAASLLTAALLLQPTRPRRFEIGSTLFGLFYCGYLPAFWIKLRCGLPPGLPTPILQTALARAWPPVLGGASHWTVGLVATFITVATVIAADTGAYVGGKNFGRTKLIDISPKKTMEGAAAGLMAAILVAVLLSSLFAWPSMISSATMGVLVFMASLFGDLTESMLKRDAGVKDSGRLIPGHGGILDRVDSYIFTGALVYFFVRVVLPLFGVRT